MCNANQFSEIIDEIVKSYKETYGTDLKDVILYGSYARGDYDDQSDIDFAAIVSGNRLDLQNRLEKVLDKAAVIGVKNDAVISPVVIPYDEYTKYKSHLPYYKNIDKEGKKVG